MHELDHRYYMFPTGIPGPLTSDKVVSNQGQRAFSYHLLKQEPLETSGGTVRLVDSSNFPKQPTLLQGLWKSNQADCERCIGIQILTNGNIILRDLPEWEYLHQKVKHGPLTTKQEMLGMSHLRWGTTSKILVINHCVSWRCLKVLVFKIFR